MPIRPDDVERKMPIGSVKKINVRFVGRNVWISNLEPADSSRVDAVYRGNRERVKRNELWDGRELR